MKLPTKFDMPLKMKPKQSLFFVFGITAKHCFEEKRRSEDEWHLKFVGEHNSNFYHWKAAV